MSDALTTSPGPEANLGYLFRLAHQRFRAALDDALQDLGLSAQDYVVLSVFETRPELSTSDLARITQVTRQTMHTAIVGLETAGLAPARAQEPEGRPRPPDEAGPEDPEGGHIPGPGGGAGRARRSQWQGRADSADLAGQHDRYHNEHSTDHCRVKEKDVES